MKIVFKNVEQMNDYYDPSRSCNGGGYDQPRTIIKIVNNSDVYDLIHEDYDRGDFGGSEYLTIRKNGAVVFEYYSNLEDCGHSENAEIKNISIQKIADILNICNFNALKYLRSIKAE